MYFIKIMRESSIKRRSLIESFFMILKGDFKKSGIRRDKIGKKRKDKKI